MRVLRRPWPGAQKQKNKTKQTRAIDPDVVAAPIEDQRVFLAVVPCRCVASFGGVNEAVGFTLAADVSSGGVPWTR